METTIKQRLMEFLHSRNIKAGTMERKAGLSHGFVRNIGKSIGADKMSKISKAYPELNIVWLATGVGSMIVSHIEQKKNILSEGSCKASPSDGGGKSILYYPEITASMGDVEFQDSPRETCQNIVLPGYSDCQFAINACGDSMSPLIKSGNIVLLSEWTESFFDYGKIYLVITRSGYRAIKRVFPGKTEAYIECRSENAEANPSFQVPVAELCRIYMVKGWVCRDSL